MPIYKQDPSDKAAGHVQGKSTESSTQCEADDDVEIIDGPPQKTHVKLSKSTRKCTSNLIELYHNI